MADLIDTINASELEVLKEIDGHGFITIDTLQEFIDRSGLFEISAASFVDAWRKAGIIQVEGNLIRISDSAYHLLDRVSHESNAEQEDTASNESPTKPYDVAKLKVEQRPLSIFQALRKIEKGEINISPDFQRAFVWDKVRQGRLIESILIRIPLPAFYIDATNEVEWNVVDGLQRLTTLFKYCREESFALEGLEFLSELNGKKFSELPRKYKVMIEDDTQLIFNNLLPGTPTRAKFTIFSRVNTGGLQLTAQEIRHALNQGKITRILKQLAEDPIFIKATGAAVNPKRMADRELVLRALAFMHFGMDRYKEFGDFDAFLVDCMEKFNLHLSDAELQKLQVDFLLSVEKVHAVFGIYAFRKILQVPGRRGPFNKALFETWVVNVRPYSLEDIMRNRDTLVSKIVHVMINDIPFVNSITYATGRADAVKKRIETVSEILRSSLGGPSHD